MKRPKERRSRRLFDDTVGEECFSAGAVRLRRTIGEVISAEIRECFLNGAVKVLRVVVLMRGRRWAAVMSGQGKGFRCVDEFRRCWSWGFWVFDSGRGVCSGNGCERFSTLVLSWSLER